MLKTYWGAKLATCRTFFISVLFCFSFSCIAVSLAYAYDCGDPSPSHEDEKPPDAGIDARDLTRSERDTIEKLFNSFVGNWQGEAEDLECHGKDNYERRRDTFTIRAEVTTDRNGNLRLESELRSAKNRNSHIETMEFYLVDNRLRLDTDSAAGDIENLEVSKNKVRFSTKRGLRSGYLMAAQPKREFFITLTKTSNSFTIEKQVYTHGKLNSASTRRFIK